MCLGLCAPSFLTPYWKASVWLTRQGFCLERNRGSVEVRYNKHFYFSLFMLVYKCVSVCVFWCKLSGPIQLQPPPPLPLKLNVSISFGLCVFILGFAIRRIMLHSFQRAGNGDKKRWALNWLSSKCGPALNFNVFHTTVLQQLLKHGKQSLFHFIFQQSSVKEDFCNICRTLNTFNCFDNDTKMPYLPRKKRWFGFNIAVFVGTTILQLITSSLIT